MIDLSQESEQMQPILGPVPAGSIVIVSMNLRDPGDHRANDNPVVYIAKSGLRQIYCQFDVVKGQYAGVNWRQSITLPVSMQVISLSESQKTACRIGGATMRAIMESANRKLQLNDLRDFNGMRFPVKVKLNNQPYEKDGVKYWRNEIASVITPSMDDYNRIKQAGEIINQDGQISLDTQPPQKVQQNQPQQLNEQGAQWEQPQQYQQENNAQCQSQQQPPYGSESNYMNTFSYSDMPQHSQMPQENVQSDSDRVPF